MGGGITTVVALLLWALICSRFGHCHQCEVYDQSDADLIARCDSLIKALEAALLTDNNLFILHHTFFSATQNSPTALIVKYVLIYSNSSDLQLDRENVAEFRYGWTSSSVYAVVDPISIIALETGIFGLVYDFAITDYNTSFPPIILNLDIRNNSIETTNYTEAELSFALETVTTQLKPYAQYQDKLESWDGKENKGYIWKFEPNFVLVLAELFLLPFVFAVSFKLGWSFNFIKRLQDQTAVQVFPALFWSIAFTSFFWNAADISVNSIYLNDMLFNEDIVSTDNNKYYAASKLAVICLVSLFALVWMLLGCIVSTSFIQPPGYIVFMGCCCICCCVKKGKYRLLYCCAFLNISLFFFLITANIIPIIIRLFVNPVVVLSVVALLFTLFFSLAMFLIVPMTSATINQAPSTPNTKQRRKYAEIFKYLLLLGLFSAVMFFVVILYLEVVIKGAGPSDYIKVLFSFALSASLGGITYFVRRKFLNQKNSRKTGRGLGKNETPSDDEDTDQTDIELERLEEGRSETRANGRSTNEDRGAGGGLRLEDEARMNTFSQGSNSEN